MYRIAVASSHVTTTIADITYHRIAPPCRAEPLPPYAVTTLDTEKIVILQPSAVSSTCYAIYYGKDSVK